MALGFFLDAGYLLDDGLYLDGTYKSPGVGEYTGAGLYLVFDTIVISADYRKFTVDQNIGVKDASAGADTARLYLHELNGGKATFEGLYQTEASAISGIELIDKTPPGSYGVLTWAMEGPVAGTPIHSANVVVKGRKIELVFEDVIKLSIDFEFNGAITEAVQ